MADNSSGSGRRLVQSTKTPDGKDINFYEDGPIQSIYADGVHSIAIGPSVSRLSLFVAGNTVPDPDGSLRGEERFATYMIVLPTPALLTALTTIAKQLSQQPAVLEQGFRQAEQAIESMLGALK